jgi:pantothenate synthetase
MFEQFKNKRKKNAFMNIVKEIDSLAIGERNLYIKNEENKKVLKVNISFNCDNGWLNVDYLNGSECVPIFKIRKDWKYTLSEKHNIYFEWVIQEDELYIDCIEKISTILTDTIKSVKEKNNTQMKIMADVIKKL